MEQQQDQPMQGKKSNTMVLVIVVIIVVLGGAAAVYFFTQSDEATNTAVTNTSVTTNTEETNTNTAAPTSNAKPYDGKKINISSADGKIEGLAGVKYTEFEGNEYVLVGFFFKIHDAFSQKSNNVGNTVYSLLANHIKSTETRVNDGTIGKGTNMLGGIYCDKDVMPDIFEIIAGNMIDQTINYIDCTYGTTEAWEDTDAFHHEYAKAFSIDTFTLQDVYDLNKLEIYDASQYWVEEMYEGLESSTIDNEAAIANAPIVATYTLEYEEQ